MTMKDVVSSNIKQIGHDPETQNLHVTFHSGQTYVYHGVTAEHHKALLSAPSIGNFLNKKLKPNHKFSKL